MSEAGRTIEEQIEALLGNLREAVVMTTVGGRILTANAAFLELIDRQHLTTVDRLDTYIGGTAFREFLNELGPASPIHRREIEVQIGKVKHWLEISVAPITEEGASGPATLFVFHDISRQKKLEQMRTEFVANVSHELRTPVTVIKGFAETLLEDDAVLSGEERSRFLQKIGSNAERLDALLRDLLLLARLESTEMVLHRERTSLSGLLKDLVANWQPQIETGNRRLLLDFAAGDDAVLVDPLRLTQVMNNLVENSLRHARDFTEIRISTMLEPGGIRLVFADNGSGIPEHELPHIFQRFYRVDKGRSRDSGGTGLGLSIVKHLVQHMGGQLELDSREGVGTRAAMVFPTASTTSAG